MWCCTSGMTLLSQQDMTLSLFQAAVDVQIPSVVSFECRNGQFVPAVAVLNHPCFVS